MQVQGLSLHSAVHSTYIYSHESKPNFVYGLRLSYPLKRVSKSTSVPGNRGGLVSVRCAMGAERKESDCDDGFYMKRCVEIARKAIGCTSPNPMVGCVIVKDGKVVGEGFHPKAGQPHAEVFALRSCGDLAENATAYVSLEPCNHYGRTPPCTEALIKAKVKRVVVGMVDPNPIVSSKGVDRLREAGIEVTVGVEEEICKSLNESYIHQIVTGNPFVAFRYSLSVNGKIVDQIGEGAAEPGGYYSKLLQEYDAVIVSSAAIAENFVGFSSREPGANQPLWIIVSSYGNSSSIKVPDLKSEADSKLIVFCDQETKVEPELAENGVETVVLNKMNLAAILEYCKRQGFCSVLLDLRGDRSDENNLLQQGFEQYLVRKIVVEILPIWAESHGERTSPALESVAKAIALKKLQPKIMGKSVLLEGYF